MKNTCNNERNYDSGEHFLPMETTNAFGTRATAANQNRRTAILDLMIIRSNSA